MKYYLTNKAKNDLKEIARYTQKVWGIKQRNNYLKLLDRTFSSLALSPEKGILCNHIRDGYRKFWLGNHVIFYRQVISSEIEIVRILHQSMDIENHLGKIS